MLTNNLQKKLLDINRLLEQTCNEYQFRTQDIEVYRMIIDLRDGKQLIRHDYAERIRQFSYPAGH